MTNESDQLKTAKLLCDVLQYVKDAQGEDGSPDLPKPVLEALDGLLVESMRWRTQAAIDVGYIKLPEQDVVEPRDDIDKFEAQ